MQCPHCDIAFSEKDAWQHFTVESTSVRYWEWSCYFAECPECEELVIHIERTHEGNFIPWAQSGPEYPRRLVYPLSAPPRSVATGVPEHLKADYQEAYQVLPVSPKASAALSRRVLQSILVEQGYVGRDLSKQIDAVSAPPRSVATGVPEHLKADYQEAYQVLPVSPKASAALSRRVLQSILVEQGYVGRDLSKQIDAVLKDAKTENALPPGIQGTVDAIFGNFSAHPITDVTSLQIIDVEPEEAEWCLQIVERLFDHYYVRPAEDQRMLDDLNEKLSLAGKPAAKS